MLKESIFRKISNLSISNLLLLMCVVCVEIKRALPTYKIFGGKSFCFQQFCLRKQFFLKVGDTLFCWYNAKHVWIYFWNYKRRHGAKPEHGMKRCSLTRWMKVCIFAQGIMSCVLLDYNAECCMLYILLLHFSRKANYASQWIEHAEACYHCPLP